ncbi:DMT family transporter [Variovorax sp. ZT4R33]|uniref:DMT family transporter n=1 Tax=Variovorax sp. ZT4R33 TaxID=3443743 RepID=UPI003F4807A4
MPAVFVLIWSTGFIVARYGMPYAPPLKFLAVRYALSFIAFAAWALIARVAWPTTRAQWGHLAVTGILVQAGYLAGVWGAVRAGMGSGLVALMVGLQPVLTGVWLSLRGGRITGHQWAGLLLGFTGLVLVVSRKFGDSGEVSPQTLSLAVAALLSITAGTLYQKRFVAPCDVRSASLVQFAAAVAVTAPFATMEAAPIVWNTHSAGAMAWSVLVLSLGGSSLFYILIQRGSAAAVTSLLYLVPPTTAVMAWLLFSESITALTLLGTAVTAAGVALVVRDQRRP